MRRIRAGLAGWVCPPAPLAKQARRSATLTTPSGPGSERPIPRLDSADALVTNGQSRIGLNVARSLGRAGMRVILGAPTPDSPGFGSRYVSGHFVYPWPSRSPEAFVETVAREVDRWHPRVLIPADDASLAVLARAADRFVGRTILACPPYATVRQVLDKEATLALAARLDIPIPRTVSLDPERSWELQLEDFQYPVILKPRLKRLEEQRNEIKVLYCRDRAELMRRLTEHGERPWILQEYVRGTDVGVVALAQKGRPLALFQQRSLRELPPGGLSVLRVAEPLDPCLQDYASRILGALEWDGLAMVEFRVGLHGPPVLLEVNGRFWGSLALALAVGMDFPLWLHRYLVEGQLPPRCTYRAGVRCRWLVGEIQRLEYLLRGWPGTDPLDRPARLQATWDFITGFLATLYYDEFVAGDFGPGLVDLWQSTGLRVWHKIRHRG